MELKENCVICQIAMTRNPVVRLLPCLHLFHKRCAQPMIDAVDSACPICRSNIIGNEEIERKKYNKNNEKHRERIVNCANRGEDWIALAATLGVKYKTAYHWVQSGNDNMLPKGGTKPKTVADDGIGVIVSWVEEDCTITLQQLKEKIMTYFNKMVSVSTVGNYLEGRLYSVKGVHIEPLTMNSEANKIKRLEYVKSLNAFIQQGKQIVWMDETNFSLFCRRTTGHARVGNKAVQHLMNYCYELLLLLLLLIIVMKYCY